MSNEVLEYSVSELSFAIKKVVENSFFSVRVKGEISGCKRADSGHYYLTLKDENANLSAVVWKTAASKLMVKPEDGLEVIVSGKITTFAGKSNYQMVIEQMEVSGAGALLKLLEERKKKFMQEGLFDASHKQKIPFLPKVIGVVTSPTGAVIRDIIHRVSDRFGCHIIVWPCLVQGAGAENMIAQAIKGFNDLPQGGNIAKPDVLIVARGGGSLEDLWCFNEEVVIRAVYDSKIPIVSAVGHETDTMLIDYVADKRAPTPTGAAEFVVPVKAEIVSNMLSLQGRISNSINRFLQERKLLIEALKRGIPNLEHILFENVQKLDDKSERLKLVFGNYLVQKQNMLKMNEVKPSYINNVFDKRADSLSNLAARLESVSVDSVLSRGFAWIKDGRGKTIYNQEQAKKSASLEVVFADGSIKTKPIVRKNELQGNLFGD